MSEVSSDSWFAGVDGCRAGWVVAFARRRCTELRVRVVPRFADVLAAPEAPALIAIDIPIGLPERVGCGGRTAENMVRPFLGARKSSVFSVPSRHAVFAEVGPFLDQRSRHAAHQRACVVARDTSDPPRGITIFAFGIFSKIREVDALLRVDCILRRKVRETHPELAFWRLNGERPLPASKKSEIGLALRRRLLVKAGFSSVALNSMPPKGAALDDVIDAIACAEIARRITIGCARPFPDPPEHDAVGLPMAIWA